jgi:hypothetical protein
MSRRRRVWLIRWIDRHAATPVQRAIYLGDDRELIERVKELLASWRAERQFAEEAVLVARQARLLCASLHSVIGRPRRRKGAAAGRGGSCSSQSEFGARTGVF